MILYKKEYLSKKFRDYRKKAKLTQEELSEKIGIAEKHYGKLERGIYYPSIETFFKIIETLNIPISEFLIQNNSDNNDIKEKLLEEIFSSSTKELELYLNIIQSIKKFKNK